MSRVILVCGHYGTGKTNYTVNEALRLARCGEKVTVVDLDVVNPYFRSSDYTPVLENAGIRVISPPAAGTTLDSPYLSPAIYAAFEGDGVALFDVGGDDAGAYALGSFSERINALPDVEGRFVINRFRNLIADPDDAVGILREVEAAGHVRMTGIVNNSHLCALTDENTVLSSLDYAQAVCGRTGLPLIATVIPAALSDRLKDRVPLPYPAQVYVSLPWNENAKRP